ncbi:hypothetical protein ANCCAN_12292 [Ancylostoma caninum]|uniref:Uncharacterized protein n=1 Tax=Ancylostoma caninum TaxID=29170 RepID=A0A368GBK4_ANCCA|nr:hypothetical protein ANCCAN_12292 [Ancylostoma caninum]
MTGIVNYKNVQNGKMTHVFQGGASNTDARERSFLAEPPCCLIPYRLPHRDAHPGGSPTPPSSVDLPAEHRHRHLNRQPSLSPSCDLIPVPVLCLYLLLILCPVIHIVLLP